MHNGRALVDEAGDPDRGTASVIVGLRHVEIAWIGGNPERREQPAPARYLVLVVVPLRAVGCEARVLERDHLGGSARGEQFVTLRPAAVQVHRYDDPVDRQPFEAFGHYR